MKVKTLKVSLAFRYGALSKLTEISGVVLQKLYPLAVYANPPVTQVELQTAREAFMDACVAQQGGGPVTTATRDGLRQILSDLMKQLALFVEIKCGNDLATLLSSGFEAASTNTTQSQLPMPDPVSVKNGLSGQMVLKTTVIDNAVCYAVEVAPVDAQGQPGDWTDGGLHTKSGAMPVNNLTPGGLYNFRMRAVGGLTGYSDWSNVVTGRSL